MVDSTKHVLVIEDDRDLRDSLCAVLEIEGYRTAAASNGEEALDYLHSHPLPSLILLDLMMPIMDGQKFRTEQTKDASLAEIPVVVLSALDKPRQQADVDGALAYLRKPIEPELLLRTLETLL